MNIAVGSYPDYVKKIYEAEKDVILDLAKSPCIIVGRCANYVLQEAGIPSFDVFCYGDLEKRKAHAAELDEAQGKDIPSTLSSVIHTGTISTRHLRERILMTVHAIRSASTRARYLRMCVRILLLNWSLSNVPGELFRPGVNIEIEVGGISYLKKAVAQIWRQPFFATPTRSSDRLR